ncbi:MAG TPA: DUF4199 domain-containing protein [Flavobacteriaceae bacterium]|jgi:hypothetical protein|nr:DUF4199 domain-containing protein [Flavobacteriaceae bacterium]
MESNTINYKEEILKSGIILAAVSIIMTMLTYMINIELMVKWWFGILSLIINVGLLIYLGITYRNSIGGILSYGNALKYSFLVMIVSFVIGICFQILLYNVIDPDLPQVMTDLSIEESVKMMENFGAPQETIDASIPAIEEGIKNSTTVSGILKSSPLGFLFMGLVSLFTAIFIKRNEPVSDRMN